MLVDWDRFILWPSRPLTLLTSSPPSLPFSGVVVFFPFCFWLFQFLGSMQREIPHLNDVLVDVDSSSSTLKVMERFVDLGTARRRFCEDEKPVKFVSASSRKRTDRGACILSIVTCGILYMMMLLSYIVVYHSVRLEMGNYFNIG